MSSKERVLTALRCQKPDRVPFMELGIDYVVGQRLLKKEQYHPGELAEFLCLDGIGTGLYPVIYVQRRTDETGRSFIVGGLIRDRSDLSMIDPGDSTDESRYDQVKQFVDKHGDKYAIFAATNIGLDPLLLSMGPENFAYALADDIRLVEEILDIYTEWSAETVTRLQQCGIDIIWFTDDIAFNSSMMFSPEFFREVAKPRLARVMDQVKVPAIFHSDGFILPVIEDLIDLGFSGIHPLDPCAVDIEQVKETYGSRICLIGNIDLRYALVNGHPHEVEQEVRDRVTRIGRDGGYILSSANTITGYCKDENILAMRDALLKYGAV